MKETIINARIRPPEIRRELIERKRLAQLVKLGMNKKLTIVEAGAGNGKTTTVAASLAELSDGQIRWISLAQDCNHLFVFWSYLVEVLQEDLGAEKEAFLDFFQAGMSQESITELVAYLSNCLPLEGKYRLVLDDFHHINDPIILASFEEFLNQITPNFHVILISRYEPAIYLGQLEMANELQYISEQDFYLSSEESKQFIAHSLTDSLTAENEEKLISAANGWIGGLQLLVAANLRSTIDDLQIHQQDNHLLSAYLSREIFVHLEKEEQDFLIRTSDFSAIDKGLAEILLPAVDFTAMMAQLIHKNLLIACTNKQDQVYNYHPIFKEYLTFLFRELSDTEQIDLKKKAIGYYLKNSQIDEAVALLFQLEEYDRLMALLLKQKQSLRMIYYIGEVPVEAALKNVDFAYQKLFYHYSMLDYAACFTLIDCLEMRYPDSEEIQAARGFRIMLGESIPSVVEQQLPSFSDIHNLKLNDISKAFIFLKNAAFAYYQDHFWEALDFIQQSLQLNQTYNNPFLNYFGSILRSQTYEEIGELEKSQDILHQVTENLNDTAFSETIRDNCILSFHLTIAGIQLKQMTLDKAENSLEQLKQRMQKNMDFAFYYNYIEFLYLSEKPEKAYEVLEELKTGHLAQYYSSLTSVGLLRYCLQYNQLSNHFKETFFESYGQFPKYHNLQMRLFHTMLLLDSGRLEEALNEVNQVLAQSREKKIYFKITDACLLKIKILLAMPEREERLIKDLYSESLYYGSTYQINVLFHYYRGTLQEFYQLFAEYSWTDLNMREQQFHQKLVLRWGAKKSDILTEREIEVLQQIATGKTNKEISRELFISLATVKTHILNLYRKLEVNSRIGAVEKGRELRLL
ncbi:LuxR C-terminal-related transcriptional regulator [Enterococcus larvae]|uniref:helix-turn-helix transcriptional regulator n=1 Tax=Enterococcus larvae TaxID=2794352 RepID=UPI003F347EF0